MSKAKTLLSLGFIVVLALIGLLLGLPHTTIYSSGTPELDEGEGGGQQMRQHINGDEASLEGLTVENVEATPSPTRARPMLEPDFEDGVLQKRAYSSRMRLVFLVGLEGTGHHYMADVLDKTCKKSEVPCPKVCTLAKAMYPGLAKPKNPSGYKDARETIRREMQNLAFAEEDLPEGKATTASFGVCRLQSGMMSYPNFNGDDKTLQYVDFRIVAEEAERAGVDVRMIYLTRSAESIMISDTQHNSYGDTFMMEARVLLANAAVVESTFRELDPNFTTCFRYENISDPTQASSVAQFVSPTNFTAQRLAKMMVDSVKDKSKSHPSKYIRKITGGGGSGGGGGGSKHWHGGKLDQRNQHEAAEAEEEDVLGEAKRLVVERLQQKLDRIEHNQC